MSISDASVILSGLTSAETRRAFERMTKAMSEATKKLVTLEAGLAKPQYPFGTVLVNDKGTNPVMVIRSNPSYGHDGGWYDAIHLKREPGMIVAVNGRNWTPET